MLPLAWGMLGAGALSALGNYFGSKSAANAQEDAANKNLQLGRETNAQNLDIFHQSRGSGGNALLPEYFGNTEGELGGNAADVARMLFGYGGGPQARLDTASNLLRGYEPTIAAGDKTIYDLATGVTGANRLASLQPVLGARTNLAKTRSASILQSLDETLAGLRAGRAASGFRGGSTFDTNRALAATTGARAAAAGEMGQATLDNALATHGLNDSNLQLLLQSLDMPFARGGQRLAFNNLPISSTASSYNDAMAPLNFFRMGGANPPYAPTPQVPVIPNTGQIAGAGVAAGGQAIGQYLAQQQMMQQLRDFFKPQGGGGNTGSNGSYDDMAAAMNSIYGGGP